MTDLKCVLTIRFVPHAVLQAVHAIHVISESSVLLPVRVVVVQNFFCVGYKFLFLENNDASFVSQYVLYSFTSTTERYLYCTYAVICSVTPHTPNTHVIQKHMVLRSKVGDVSAPQC